MKHYQQLATSTLIHKAALPVIDEVGGGHTGSEVSLTASSTLTLPLDVSLPLKVDNAVTTDDLFLPDDCESARLTAGCETKWALGSARVSWATESSVALLLFLWRSRRLRRPRLDVSLGAAAAEFTATSSVPSDVISLGPSLTFSTDVLSTSNNHHTLLHYTRWQKWYDDIMTYYFPSTEFHVL